MYNPTDLLYTQRCANEHEQLRDLFLKISDRDFILMGDFNYKGNDWSNKCSDNSSVDSRLFLECINKCFVTQHQWCSGAGTHRNAVPVNILGRERRSGSYLATKAERCCCSVPANIYPKIKFCLF